MKKSVQAILECQGKSINIVHNSAGLSRVVFSCISFHIDFKGGSTTFVSSCRTNVYHHATSTTSSFYKGRKK